MLCCVVVEAADLPLLAALAGPVGEAHDAVAHGHVGAQEVGQRGGGGRGPVEREAHGAPVRVLAVADAAVRRRVITRPHQVLLHLTEHTNNVLV